MQSRARSDEKIPKSVNPYMTGGGGVVFEHRYGAVLLSHLLTETPIPGLGDHITPSLVVFQGKDESPVDDMLVYGHSEAGDEHRLSVGARHLPRLTKDDKKSVSLIATYLQIVSANWADVESGRWRLALAVAPSCPPAAQLRELAVIADAAGADADFRVAVAKLGRTTSPVRNRLKRLDEIVAEAAKGPSFDAGGCSLPELTWRLLAKLSVDEFRLEGVGGIERTHAVERLVSQTPDGKVSSADKLFSRLTELVGGYSPGGARVTRDTLCTALRGHRFFRQPDDEGASAADQLAPTIRAEALTLGPIEAIAGLAELLASAEKAVGEDPDAAVAKYEQLAEALGQRGFHGHALLIRQRSAKELQTAGHAVHAANVLVTQVERLVGQGAEHEALLPVSHLQRLCQPGDLPPETLKATSQALSLYHAVIHPFADLADLAQTFDTLAHERDERLALYGLILAETAVATGQLSLVRDRATMLTGAADEATDKLQSVRIKISVAEATDDWTTLVRAAERRRLPRPCAALVLARYARVLTLTAQPDEADKYWAEAANLGALAELGNDTAEWLYALRENTTRYGPITPEFETHQLAQAMRLSGGRTLLPNHQDHYAAALDQLRNDDLARACESGRRALRDAVTSGHLVSEFMAANLLAEIFTRSGEGARAAALHVHTGHGEKLTELLEQFGDQYLDLTEHLESAAPWQRHAAYAAVSAQADLVDDSAIEGLLRHALADVEAGLAGRIRQAPFLFAPQLEKTALAAVASLIERAAPGQVVAALDALEPLVTRTPGTYRHTDEGHVRTLASVLDRDDEFGPAAATQLLEMLASNESVAQQVLKIADDAIERRVELFRDRLPQLIETSFAAAWLLARLGMIPPANSQAVRTAFETLIAPYQQPPGTFGMGLPLALNAMLARHLPQAECEQAARAQLARSRDHGQPAMNRWECIDALRALSGSVSDDMRSELFSAGISFAQGHEDGSALDDMTGQPHPLSHFRISFGMASLAVPGIRLAAATSSSAESAELVERTAIPLLNQPDRQVTAGVVGALTWLGKHPAALPSNALAIHSDPNVRSLAAIRWASETPHDRQVGMLLASDPDHHVRGNLAHAIAQTVSKDPALEEVRDKLSSDPRYSVRSACQPTPKRVTLNDPSSSQ